MSCWRSAAERLRCDDVLVATSPVRTKSGTSREHSPALPIDGAVSPQSLESAHADTDNLLPAAVRPAGHTGLLPVAERPRPAKLARPAGLRHQSEASHERWQSFRLHAHSCPGHNTIRGPLGLNLDHGRSAVAVQKVETQAATAGESAPHEDSDPRRKLAVGISAHQSLFHLLNYECHFYRGRRGSRHSQVGNLESRYLSQIARGGAGWQ